MTNWIETKDRLPEIGKTVLVYASKNILLGEFVSINPIGFKVFNVFVLSGDIATHWAELPEAPETV